MKQTDSAVMTKFFIGRAQVTCVSPLPGSQGKGGRLLAIGNMAASPSQPILGSGDMVQSSLTAIDFLVAGTDCNMESLLETVIQLKEIHPQLRVVLAESKESPRLSELPLGVESIMLVAQDKAEVGRSLLFQQAGILAGINAGMAAYLAFIMEGQMETGATIAMATTNLTPQLLSLQH